MRTQSRVLAHDAVSMDLPEISHPGMWVEGGWPRASTASLGAVGNCELSIWEITSGVVADIENDEVIVVLAGTGRIQFEDGEQVVLRRGTCFQLHAAERTEWTVDETLRAITITAS